MYVECLQGSFFARPWFHVWPRLVSFLNNPSFSASLLCFLTVAFPGYLHLYLSVKATNQRFAATTRWLVALRYEVILFYSAASTKPENTV